MKIILVKNVKNVGKIGQLVTVKAGYARNFLFPKEQALLATEKNIKFFENKKVVLEKEKKEQLLLASLRSKKISSIGTINIFAKSKGEGKLFGSVGVNEIIKEIGNLGHRVRKQEIKFPNGVLRKIGKHSVFFEPNKNTSIKLIVNVIEKK